MQKVQAPSSPKPLILIKPPKSSPSNPISAMQDAKGNWQVERYHAEINFIPKGDWTWVFASNLAGRHNAGAEKIARVNFRAEYGSGNGPTGHAFAIATRDKHQAQLDLPAIKANIEAFIAHALANPRTRFFVTHIVVAGTTDEGIAEWFSGAPKNCTLPMQWKLPPSGTQTH